jgi:hypothetical protein
VFLPFLRYLDQIYICRGERGFLMYLKAVRSAYLGYLSNNPEKVVGVKVTRDGIPVALGDFVPIIRRSNQPRVILPFLSTILWCTRSLNLGGLPDIKTITEPASVQVPTVLGTNSVDF